MGDIVMQLFTCFIRLIDEQDEDVQEEPKTIKVNSGPVVGKELYLLIRE